PGVDSRAARRAPQEPVVQQLPFDDRSARVRARELRRDRRLAHDRRIGASGRRARDDDERRDDRRPRGAARGAARAARAVSARAAAAPVHRFQTFYVPNGMAMEHWLPKTEGAAFELTPILEPLAAYRSQMLVLSGIKANWNYIHAGASGSFLTGTARGGRNEIEIVADVSIDQLL